MGMNKQNLIGLFIFLMAGFHQGDHCLNVFFLFCFYSLDVQLSWQFTTSSSFFNLIFSTLYHSPFSLLFCESSLSIFSDIELACIISEYERIRLYSVVIVILTRFISWKKKLLRLYYFVRFITKTLGKKLNGFEYLFLFRR